MLRSIFENVLASVICAFIAAGAKRVFNYLKTPSEQAPHTGHASRSVVQKQFLISLAVMAITLPVMLALPKVKPFTLIGCLKAFLSIADGFAVILAWGAFDAAFEFYPPDDPAGVTKTDNHASNPGK
jgi:hypothetical protein